MYLGTVFYFKFVSPSRLLVSTKLNPFLSELLINIKSAGKY